MTTTSRDLPDLQAWACRQLNVPATASPIEARAAFLRKLSECAFVPPRAWEISQGFLSQPSEKAELAALAEQALPDEEARLRAEVKAFAEQFFDLGVRERQARHHALAAACAWLPGMSDWLQSLAAGLHLEPQSWHDAPAAVRELIQHICEIFTLAGAEKAKRRWEILQALENSIEGPWHWAEIACIVVNSYADVATLDTALIQQLEPRDERRRQKSLPRMPKPATAGSSGGYVWWAAPLVVAVFTLLRLIGGMDRSPPPPPPPLMQDFHQEFDWQKIQEQIRQNPEKFGEATKRLFGDKAAKKLLEKTDAAPREKPPEKNP